MRRVLLLLLRHVARPQPHAARVQGTHRAQVPLGVGRSGKSSSAEVSARNTCLGHRRMNHQASGLQTSHIAITSPFSIQLLSTISALLSPSPPASPSSASLTVFLVTRRQCLPYLAAARVTCHVSAHVSPYQPTSTVCSAYVTFGGITPVSSKLATSAMRWSSRCWILFWAEHSRISSSSVSRRCTSLSSSASTKLCRHYLYKNILCYLKIFKH